MVRPCPALPGPPPSLERAKEALPSRGGGLSELRPGGTLAMVYDLHFEAGTGLACSLLPHFCELKGIGFIVTPDCLPLFSLSFVDLTIWL